MNVKTKVKWNHLFWFFLFRFLIVLILILILLVLLVGKWRDELDVLLGFGGELVPEFDRVDNAGDG